MLAKREVKFYPPTGKLGFLSNFYKSKITIDGVTYSTSEHAFQAMKFVGESKAVLEYKELIAKANTPGIAKVIACQKTGGGYKWRTNLNLLIEKYLSLGVKLRPDWERVKDQVMYCVLQEKFRQNPELKVKLLQTSDIDLEEMKRVKEEISRLKEKGYEVKMMMVSETGDKEAGTEDNLLVEDSPRDWYWGVGKDGKGKNMLGILLTKLRAEFIDEISR